MTNTPIAIEKGVPFSAKWSRQYRWQLKRKAQGLCVCCSQPVWRDGAWTCLPCTVARRERHRKYSGAKRRNINSPSYKASSGKEAQ